MYKNTPQQVFYLHAYNTLVQYNALTAQPQSGWDATSGYVRLSDGTRSVEAEGGMAVAGLLGFALGVLAMAYILRYA